MTVRWANDWHGGMVVMTIRYGHERNATCSMGGHKLEMLVMSEMRHVRWVATTVRWCHERHATGSMGGHGREMVVSETRHVRWVVMAVRCACTNRVPVLSELAGRVP